MAAAARATGATMVAGAPRRSATDGRRIVFTSDRDRPGRERLGRGFDVYTMAVDGTDIRRVTNNRSPDIFSDWQRLP